MGPDTPSGVPVTEQPSGVRAIRLVTLALLIGVSVFTASTIARVTNYAIHPDETEHADAFCYYASHVWPPDLNVDGLIYSMSGWSRVYNSELVYLIYGRAIRVIGFLLQPEAPAQLAPIPELDARPARVFLPLVSTEVELACGLALDSVLRASRSLNVMLLFATLVLLLLGGRRHIWTGIAGLLMMCLPQVIYLYSYANSDAWGLSMSLFLIAFVLIRGERLFRSLWSVAALAVLTGLVLLTKETFWVSIPFAYLYAGLSVSRAEWNGRAAFSWQLVGALALVVGISLALIAPMRFYYPYTQGDFEARVEEMREERAMPAYKPSQVTAGGYWLARRGVPFWKVSRDLWWYERSSQSTFGVFGWMNVESSPRARQVAGAAFAALASATYLFAVLRWRTLPESLQVGLVVAPLFVVLAVLLSLLNSWRVDEQPQGRYLFDALMPAAIIMAGTIALEPRWLRGVRAAAFAVLFVLCQIVLWTTVVFNPALTG